MSKNMKGILGAQYGKVGPVVGRKFREENVYSAYQGNVVNPRSVAQQLHRARFRVLSTLAHDMACGAIFGFRVAAKGTNLSPRNLFQKVNWPHVSASSPTTTNVDYTSIEVSKGGLSSVSFDIPGFDIPSSVKVDWTEFGSPCHRTANDKVAIYIYCPDAKQGILKNGLDIADQTASVAVPRAWNGMKVHVWGFVRNDGAADLDKDIPAGECSPSKYLGSGNIG